MSCDFDLNRLWSIELEILDEFHKFCMMNNLRYSLAYGTLIGAVRHKGFIPWDDDVDVIMPRKDYEIFLQKWNSSTYILQNYNTDFDCTNNFSKLRKNNTLFIHNEEEKNKHYNKGIFIDIFPADHIAPNRICRIWQYVCCAVNLLYSRGYTSGNRKTEFIELFLLKIKGDRRIRLRNKCEGVMSKWKNNDNSPYILTGTIQECNVTFPANLFDHLSMIEFSGKEYYAVNDFDVMLRKMYGDYMQLPPKKERVLKHHPICVDFGQSL